MIGQVSDLGIDETKPQGEVKETKSQEETVSKTKEITGIGLGMTGNMILGISAVGASFIVLSTLTSMLGWGMLTIIGSLFCLGLFLTLSGNKLATGSFM